MNDEPNTAPVSPSPKPPSGKKKRFLKIGIVLGILVGVLGAAYILFWPAGATLADLFKMPAALFSFIRPSEESLKSTDGRTNILLLGTDYRKELPENLTDTMVVASINLKGPQKDLVMISVPRDLWVRLPGWKFGPAGKQNFYSQWAKVNSANAYGDLYQYPEGAGLGLARQAMQEVLGIDIHYVVRVNFYGFRDAVDAVGGISVNVERAFTDCSYPIVGKEKSFPLSSRYKCVSFRQGFQTMDGEKALEFVRSRKGTNGENGDLARARRQQQVIIAIRDKTLSLPTLADPLRISNLIRSLGDNLKTLDVDFSQIGQFYKLSQAALASGAIQIVLTSDPRDEAGFLITPPAGSYGGAFVFIPRLGQGKYIDIQAYVKKILKDATEKSATQSAQRSTP